MDADGAYIGGVIAPGVNLSLQALHQQAAALPHVDIAKPQAVIGTNTVACMQSGVFWGYVGLIKEICARIRVEHGKQMQHVVIVSAKKAGITVCPYSSVQDRPISGIISIFNNDKFQRLV